MILRRVLKIKHEQKSRRNELDEGSQDQTRAKKKQE